MNDTYCTYICMESLKLLQYFLAVKCLIDILIEVESSNSKDIGSDFIKVKQLLQNHDCYTMEDLSLQV